MTHGKVRRAQKHGPHHDQDQAEDDAAMVSIVFVSHFLVLLCPLF